MRRLNKLELAIHDLKYQLYASEEQKELKIKEALKWKMKLEIVEHDKNFLEKQLKDARKQNRLLKIAISKLQNDFERLARETKHPINIAYSLHEEDKNNLLEQLDQVIKSHQDNGEDLSNNEVLQKLEEQNLKMAEIAKTQLDSYTAYIDDEGLREKLNKSENKNRGSRSLIHHSNKSSQKFESPQKKSINDLKSKRARAHVPVGSAQNVSAIKKKLGSDENWNKF